jgi:hypothetical protein
MESLAFGAGDGMVLGINPATQAAFASRLNGGAFKTVVWDQHVRA